MKHFILYVNHLRQVKKNLDETSVAPYNKIYYIVRDRCEQ